MCVCLSSIGGQTAGPIMTKFGTHMRIHLGMVPTKYWPHEWPGSVGSLGPISESGLSCQLLLRAVVWQMTSQLIRRRNDVVFAAFNQSRISRAERLFNYDVIDSHAVGCNSNKQNDPIDDALRGHHALASLPAGI